MFALTVVFSPFLSTPSARRATFNRPCHIHLFLISIHALRKEGDGDGRERMISDIEFLSTPSARRATRRSTVCVVQKLFLSTPSARRATGFPHS